MFLCLLKRFYFGELRVRVLCSLQLNRCFVLYCFCMVLCMLLVIFGQERRSSAVLSKEFTTTTTAATAVAAAVTVTAVTNPASVGLTTKKAIHTFNWYSNIN